jgi:gamma-glutamyl phosphate reductase
MKQEQHNNVNSLSDQLFEGIINISKAHAYDILVEQVKELTEENERLKLSQSKLSSTIQELKEVRELCMELSDTLKECMKTIWSEHPDGWKDVFLRHFKGHPYDKAESLIDRANKQLDTK